MNNAMNNVSTNKDLFRSMVEGIHRCCIFYKPAGCWDNERAIVACVRLLKSSSSVSQYIGLLMDMIILIF